jgi:serine/threonine protein kinase
MSTFAMAPMVKLTDFGLVPSGHQRQLYSPPDEDEDQQLIVALMHSEGWTAPDGQLTSASDIFITGCLFSFVLGKGFHPFGSNALSRVKRIVRKRSMVLTLQQLENLPNAADALMLIQSMVNFNPAERPSIQQVLNSGFLAIPLASPTVHVPGIVAFIPHYNRIGIIYFSFS